MKFLDEMSKTAKSVCALIAFATILFTSYFTIDNWKANAKDLEKTNFSIQQMKEEHEIEKLENRYKWLGSETFELNEKYRSKSMPEETRKRVHDNSEEQELIRLKLDKFHKGR